MSNVVFSIQRGVITCHKYTKKLASGYRLEDGTLLKGEQVKHNVGFEPLDVITLTENAEEAMRFAKAEISRMHDIIQVATAARYDVETWASEPDYDPPASRIV